MWQPTISSDEIYHEGILGMHWGQRNGPPYPLKEGAHSAAEKKAMKKAARQEKREARKAKKQAKLEVKKQKEAAKKEAQRQKVINSGSLKEIKKLKGELSNDEYRQIFSRLENEHRLDNFDKEYKKNMASKVSSARSVIGDIDSASSNALRIYNRGAAIYNVIADKKGWEPRELPIIEVRAKDKDNDNDNGNGKKKNKNKNKDDED